MKTSVLIVLTLSVCFFNCNPVSVSIKEKETTREDFEINVNDNFKIQLKSNPTTGYRWRWANNQDVNIVDSINWRFIADKPVLPGRGGMEIWTFKGIREGIDSIRMEYCRPWEKNVPPAETKTFFVKVR